jgi:exportin-2 (importin alpha re-exporter)
MLRTLTHVRRFVVSGTPSTLPTFEQVFFGPFTFILQQDIDREELLLYYNSPLVTDFVSLHFPNSRSDVGSTYHRRSNGISLPCPIPHAYCWQQKGSIPSLVKLFNAFLARDAAEMINTGPITAVLAVIQQRLIPSKINDG